MKAVVFDFGGVVFQWRPEQLLRRVLPQHVHDDASARDWLANFFQGYGGDWGEFDRGVIGADGLVERIARRTTLSVAEVRAVVDAVPAELQPVPETLALIEALHAAGHELFYLSNMPAPYAEHLTKTHAVMARFRAGVFSSQLHVIKPDARIFELAAQRFGRPPQELLFLDDSLINVEAARQLGWGALHFRSAAQAAAEMRALGVFQSR